MYGSILFGSTWVVIMWNHPHSENQVDFTDIIKMKIIYWKQENSFKIH